MIDGAQAAGATPVDVKALGCHFYATTGHKWLNGPKGTGLLYISAEADKQIDAMALQSGRQANSDATGISNIAGLHGLGAAIDYVRAIGIERIEQHNLALCRELRNGLADLSQSRSRPFRGPAGLAILTFSCRRDARICAPSCERPRIPSAPSHPATRLPASPHLSTLRLRSALSAPCGMNLASRATVGLSRPTERLRRFGAPQPRRLRGQRANISVSEDSRALAVEMRIFGQSEILGLKQVVGVNAGAARVG